MKKCDATAYRGFDATFTFDLSAALDSSVNLIGKTALFTVKADRKADDSTAVLKNDFVIAADDLDPDNNKALIVAFTAAQMQDVDEGSYYFDLKVFDENGVGVIYVPYQTLQVIDDVTDRIVIS